METDILLSHYLYKTTRCDVTAHGYLYNHRCESQSNLTIQQYRQCTYDVKLRRVHVTIVAVERLYYIFVCAQVCVRAGAGVCSRACSLTNNARTAPSYCLLRPHSLHHVLRHYLTNRMIFGRKKKLLNKVF
jgi:hypothetical protein